MATGVTYLEMADIIAGYYGTGSDVWQKFATGNLQGQELVSAVRQIPGADVTISRSGNVLGYDYVNPFPAPETPLSSGNSNITNSTYGTKSFNSRVNGTYTWDVTTQTGSFKSGATKAGATAKTVASKLNVAMTAVAAGMFLGAKIDSALYNVGKFFDLNPPEELNPETWDDIASSELGKSVIRHLFDIGDDGGTTAYMPEDVLEYMYRYWNELGAFSGGDITADYDGPSSNIGNIPRHLQLLSPSIHIVMQGTGGVYREIEFLNADYLTAIQSSSGNDLSFDIFTRGEQPSYRQKTSSSGSWTTYTTGYSYTTPNGVTYYGSRYTLTGSYFHNDFGYYGIPHNTLSVNNIGTITQVGTVIFDGTITTSSPVPGFDPNDPDASEHVDPSQIDPSQPILPQLKQQLPNTFNNPIQETIPQPDGTTKTKTYYPVPWPKVTDDTEKPVSGTPTQATPTITPQTPTDERDKIKDVITNINPQPTTPTPGDPATPPDTGTGSSPTVVMPTGQGSSLWTVYNPTQGQLDAFGSWLWSSNFVEQIKKLFNDPMQAIIGVHKVYATPSTGGQVNIKCGYIDSGCPAAEVTSQYTTVDCGSVSLREYFGNVLDYPPYTEVGLYLPFIGIVKLDPADVLRSTIHVIYHVDVITGACLADVKVSRDGENAILYQYSGSAICSYPLSSGSYAGVVTGVLSMAAGIAGTVLSGGAAAPALIGGAMGLTHLHTDVQKSGAFSGSAGAMGGKVPYVIISRAQDATPANFEKHEGKPASKTVTLGNCEGFVKVKSINIDDVPATYGELDQIVSLLKTGVIL